MWRIMEMRKVKKIKYFLLVFIKTRQLLKIIHVCNDVKRDCKHGGKRQKGHQVLFDRRIGFTVTVTVTRIVPDGRGYSDIVSEEARCFAQG